MAAKSEFYGLLNPSRFSEKVFLDICNIKRFYERWMADENFRNQMLVDSTSTVKEYNIDVNANEVRRIWDQASSEIVEDKEASAAINLFEEFFIEKIVKAKELHTIHGIIDSRFNAWRNRQIARCESQFHPSHHNSTAHAPVCFELSKGCSVGCWFCGVSAYKLSGIFAYEENKQIWRELLLLIKGILGDFSGDGFCYWATDPLDNQDYEKFCVDFYEILGKFPQTTTAQAWRYPDRIKSLLRLSAVKGKQVNRFSILSLKILDDIHRLFSADELANVSLVFQNREALSVKSNSGRSLNVGNAEIIESIEIGGEHISEQTSIACVSGFLFNMVEQKVQLISPCPASDRWPNGYIVYDEGVFTNISDLKKLLERMISQRMSPNVRHEDVLKFRSDLSFESILNGFQVSTKYMNHKFCGQHYLLELGSMIKKGIYTTEKILVNFKHQGISELHVLYFINMFFSKGILDDEPIPHKGISKEMGIIHSH